MLLGVTAVHGLLLWALLQASGGMHAARQAAPQTAGVLMLWRLQNVSAAAEAEPPAPRREARARAPDRGHPRGPHLLPPAAPASPLEHAGRPVAAAPPALAVADSGADTTSISAAAGAPMPTASTPPTTPRPDGDPATEMLARADHRHCPSAPYPAALQQRGIEGAALVRVRVDSEGRAAEVRLLAGSGWRLFDDAALQRARGCRFFPAMRSGAPVESWVEFPVRFALAG
jgi:protein TonB